MLKDDLRRPKPGAAAQASLDRPVAVPDEILDALVAVLDVVRHESASTRPEIIRRTGLGRGVIVQRVDELIGRGLLAEDGLGASTGGRAPRAIRLNARAGHILVADLGATSFGVGIADLSGNLVEQHEESADITEGPEAILERVDALFAGLSERADHSLGDLWGSVSVSRGPSSSRPGDRRRRRSCPAGTTIPSASDSPIVTPCQSGSTTTST